MADERRNLNPHAEARLAMALWGHEYAHEQRGGSMDFWDNIGANRRRMCVDILNGILEAQAKNGRAVDASSEPLPLQRGLDDGRRT